MGIHPVVYSCAFRWLSQSPQSMRPKQQTRHSLGHAAVHNGRAVDLALPVHPQGCSLQGARLRVQVLEQLGAHALRTACGGADGS